MSEPFPPIKVSEPEPPSKLLLESSPVSPSLKAEPIILSILLNVSVFPQLSVATPVFKLTVTP